MTVIANTQIWRKPDKGDPATQMRDHVVFVENGLDVPRNPPRRASIDRRHPRTGAPFDGIVISGRVQVAGRDGDANSQISFCLPSNAFDAVIDEMYRVDPVATTRAFARAVLKARQHKAR